MKSAFYGDQSMANGCGFQAQMIELSVGLVYGGPTLQIHEVCVVKHKERKGDVKIILLCVLAR